MKIVPLIIFILSGLLIYLSYSIKNNKVIPMWSISFLRFILPIFSIGLFGQIFLFLITLFDCQNGKMYVSTELKCRSGNNYYIHFPFVLIAIILHIFVSLITNSLYYKSLFTNSKSDVLKKTNSLTDISLLITKLLIIILFIFENENEDLHWIVLFILMLITGINAYINIYYKNKLNIKLLLLNIILSLILFIGFVSLFIGNIFKFLGFNGSIFIYFLGIIFIFIFIFLYKTKEMEYALIDYKNINNPDEYINYILKYYRIILNKSNYRNNSIILKSYIETIEGSCIDKDCPLKIYAKLLKEGIDLEYLLYQHLDNLFKFGLAKFKDNIMLINDYAYFLITKMNNKKKSLSLISKITESMISFQKKYNIYRCKKLIKRFHSQGNNFYYNFRTNKNKLRELIIKSIKIYYEFWTLLYESKFQNTDNFLKLYEKGSEILKINSEIEEKNNLIFKTKTNNLEIFKLYSDYLEKILRNEEKLQNYKTGKAFIFTDSFENEEKNYSNFNLNHYQTNNSTNYFLISGKTKDLGKIIDCSLNASSYFGYTKEELIGMHINILIPDIFHIKHNEVIIHQSKMNNLILLDKLFLKKEYKPELIETNYFGITKSKFIKSVKLKIYFIKTEKNEIGFMTEFLEDIPYMSELIAKKDLSNYNIDKRCCILTDKNLIISSFTPNSVEQLGLSYKYIKSNYSIIHFIKQIYEEFINYFNQLNSNYNGHTHTHTISINEALGKEDITNKNSIISSSIIQKIKNDVINKKYSKKGQITWIINKKLNDNLNKTSFIENNNEISNNSKISKRTIVINKIEEITEIELLLEIKKAIINNQLLGYYFYLSKLNHPETKNFISYRIKEQNNYAENENEDIAKIIKYKTNFKSNQNSMTAQKNKALNYLRINQNDNSNIFKKKEISNTFLFKANKPKEKDILQSNNIFMTEIQNNHRNSYYDDLEPNIKKASKFSSDFETIEDNVEDVIIDENFIPKNLYNFSFNLNNMSYNLENNFNNSNKLKSSLNKEAMNKIKEYEDYLNSLNKKEESSEETESDEYSSENEEESESIYNSYLNSNRDKKRNSKNLYKSITLNSKNKTIKSRIEKITPLIASYTLKKVRGNEPKNKKDDKENDNSIQNISSSQTVKKNLVKNNLNNSYYKVDLNRIRYMIFDFNRDMIRETNKFEKLSKVEDIINKIKNQNNLINMEKDENYPFVSFKTIKNNKNSIKQIEKDNNLNNMNNKIKEEKILARKISEAINNKKDEETIKSLKKSTGISFLVISLLGILILILNLYFYNILHYLLIIYKKAIFIKYCKIFSFYCIRELSLLNFNCSNIKGGIYTGYPGKNRTKYINLLKRRLVDYLKETQIYIESILSNNYFPSKEKIKTSFNIEFFFPQNIGAIKSDIITTLVQYNNALNSLANRYTPIYQNNPDMKNFIRNGLNSYENAITSLINIYLNEIKIKRIYIISYFIVASVIVFLVFLIFSIIMIINLINATKSNINYMKVFYGINLDLIRNLRYDSEKLLNELTKTENNEEEQDLKEKEKESLKIAEQKEKNNIRNIKLINNNKKNKNKSKISNKYIVYSVFYIIFMILLYFFFPYNCYILYNISMKEINTASFFSNLYKFDSNILDFFNEYREYLFDNRTEILNNSPLEILKLRENETYNKITELKKNIQNYRKTSNIKGELWESFGSRICSFYITDYFDSIAECQKKYFILSTYTFDTIYSYFLQNLRNLKNIVEYKLKTEKIIGELGIYEIEVWENWTDEDLEGKVFRLDLFNNETIHTEINQMFINVFFPYLDQMRKINFVIEENGGFSFYFYFILIILILVLLYLLYLFPMIKYLSNSIYKTKNLLLLIPMNILSSQGNIKSLLKLS